MSKPTKAEQKWLDELQEVLDRCPSKRLGFYTVGDPDVSVYDMKKQAQIDKLMDKGSDFGPAVHSCDARLGSVVFPSLVCSTSG